MLFGTDFEKQQMFVRKLSLPTYSRNNGELAKSAW